MIASVIKIRVKIWLRGKSFRFKIEEKVVPLHRNKPNHSKIKLENMKSFVIFAIVVTIIYVIYYTVIIVQDLYGKPKDEKSQGESFDVSDMTDEEESIAVSESDGGFSVGDNQYETAYEEKQLAEPTEEAAATAEESKPHVLEKIQSAIEKKMEEVNTTYSDPMYSEELNNTIIARGLRHNGRDMVKVESLNNEI